MVRELVSDEDVAACFAVVRELRPHIASVEALLTLAQQMRAEGAVLAALEEDGVMTTFAAFRIRTMLATGVTMYVDDLVTAKLFRSRGHGKAMIEWLVERARRDGCATFSLDSGTFRPEAHAFYFREGLRITCFHFAKPL